MSTHNASRYLLVSLFLILPAEFSNAQNDLTRSAFLNSDNESSVPQTRNPADYKIIASNSSYIEIEFYPQYSKPENFISNNELLTFIDFKNAADGVPDKSGEPDLKFRVLPVILPSPENNSVSIVDFDVSELKNIMLAPSPAYKLKDPNRYDFENFEVHYYKNPEVYSQNKFLPENILSLENIGTARELVMGSIVIHPYQYNPVMRVLRQYTRIRFRVNLGRSPVYLNRQRSIVENELLKDIAINSDIALRWMNPSFSSLRKSPVENSKLSTGDWYKIEVKDNGSGASDGIYKINKQFLENAGINLSGVDPRTMKMYGNGGDLLPESVGSPRPLDLVEIAIHIEGEDDGTFDPQDYILFYGRSINNWTYYPLTQQSGHYINYYTNSNYYWVCLNTPGNGKRMQTVPSENTQNFYIAPSFTEKIFYEPEINNLLMEGNLWLSERKSDGQSFLWNNTHTGLEANSNILYKIKVASRVMSPYENHFTIKEDQSNMSEVFLPMGNVQPGFGDWIYTAQTDFTINASQKTPPNSETSSFRATFHSATPDGEGYLDWMEVQYKRRFNSVLNDFLRFSSPDTDVTIEYNISPFSNNQIRIFDVNIHDSVTLIQPLSTGSNSVRFQKSHLPGLINRYIVVGQNGYKIPTSISQRIPNQNLRGYSEGASFIIVTHTSLLAAANRLKEIREQGGPSNPNYLKTYIATTQEIYNEFSGGLLDAVAIRDFLKYAYDNWQEKPVYVLLLGDGDLDYRHILVNHENLVPAFEHTDPNINQVNGYTSDDFYTWFTDNNPRPSLAIGRITARNIQDANAYLDKVECYESPEYNGYWKNRTTYVADDGRTTEGCEGSIHTGQCERLAEQHTPPVFEKTKIYLVAYPTVITSQGRRKPEVNTDIIKYWNLGTIMLSYCGHGSPDVWAHEYVFEKEVVLSQLNNKCKYAFVTVASCDFSKFDNPLSQSGGELLVTAADKGAIGSLGATRPTYPFNNEQLSNKFYDNLLYYRDTLLLQIRFGKAIFDTKQQISYGLNDYKYLLNCDPTVRVQVPRFKSNVDSMVGLKNDTMRALSRIKVYGSILNPDSSLWSSYNGKISLKLFDVPRAIHIIDDCNNPFDFVIAGGIIFSGTQSVNNGKWSVEFIVPKDISYRDSSGKLIDYFYNNQADGNGLYTNFIIGGIDPTAPADTTGPDIKLYLNNRNFRTGDMVNGDFKLIADLFDESGINTTGTIGHKIEAVLDDDVNHKYDLTTFYNSDTTYKSGSLEYDFLSVADGDHRLTLKAWDTYNNSSEVEIKFSVSSYNGLKVVNLYNYPNPFKNNTVFTFQHNYPNAVNVRIKIYTVAGRLIKEIRQDNINDKFVTIDWTGKDEDGETLGNGIYIYKLTVEAGDGASVTNVGKLAVLK